MQGAMGMGLVWCLLYGLTPLLGIGVVALTGGSVGMESIYGSLIPFAFCQGPGQSVAYGAIFEQYGWPDASAVAITMILRVRRNFFEITTFPNSGIRA